MIKERSLNAMLAVPTLEELEEMERRRKAAEEYEAELKAKDSDSAPISKSQESIAEIVDATKDLLLYKNKMYGDSALNPVGIFTKHIKTAPAKSVPILVRLDDKLGRVRNAPALRINDISDIMGYCTLLLVSMGATKEDIEKFKD